MTHSVTGVKPMVRSTALPLALLCAWGAALPLSAQRDVQDVVHRLDELVVSATRTERRVGDLPVNVTLVSPRDLGVSAAGSVGDLLKVLPGFSLLRGFSTMVGHPSTQSVSMRGLGGNAASRTLVLIDGFPLNDSFAGWVHWSRVPLASVERIEVVRGGGAGIWGNRAFGGVINIITSRPTRNEGRFALQGGGLGTVKGAGGIDYRGAELGLSLDGEYFQTDGYVPVRSDLQGPVDRPSGSDHYTIRGQGEYAFGGRVALVVDGSYFREDRKTGTALRDAALSVATLGARASFTTGDGNAWSLRLFGTDTDYSTRFSSVSEDRASERPATDQFDVPSSDLGAALQWARATVGGHELTAGVDVTRIVGETNERYVWSGSEFRNFRNAGGTQVLAGAYAQDLFPVGEALQLLLGGRLNLTRNTAGFLVESSLATGDASVDDAYDDNSRWSFDVSGGFSYRAQDRATVRGSVYTGFRAPTVHELYKPFRATGNVVVAPNHELVPERMVGGELGVDVVLSETVTGRFTGFYSRVREAVIDATIAVVESPRTVEPCGFVPAGGTCLQHQNVGLIRSVGLESEIHVVPAPNWSLSLSHVFNPTEILEAEGRPEIVGLRVPRTPRQQLSFQASYVDPNSWSVALTSRWSGITFDDDLSENELDRHLVLDGRVSRRWSELVTTFVSVENLLDNEYAVGRTNSGLVRVGLPRLVQMGVRVTS